MSKWFTEDDDPDEDLLDTEELAQRASLKDLPSDIQDDAAKVFPAPPETNYIPGADQVAHPAGDIGNSECEREVENLFDAIPDEFGNPDLENP